MVVRKAVMVYNVDVGAVVDRTKRSHDTGIFDVDIRQNGGFTLRIRDWVYCFSRKSYHNAKRVARKWEYKINVETRIVNAQTGEILLQS